MAARKGRDKRGPTFAEMTAGLGQKRPAIEQDFNHDQRKPKWRYGLIDWEWTYSFALCTDDEWETIAKRLREYERCTWADVFGKPFNRQNHPVEVAKLIPEAQRRLKQKRLGDVEDVVSLRVGKRRRVWGIRYGRTLYLLWWDPDHDICP